MAQRWGLSIEELRGAAEGAVHRVEPWAAGSFLTGRGASLSAELAASHVRAQLFQD